MVSDDRTQLDNKREASVATPGTKMIPPPKEPVIRPGGVRLWMRAAVAAAGIGRGAKESPAPVATDRGTRLAEQRTGLALERSFLAAERTLMTWIGTSLSMISFGFTMVKFFEYLEETTKLAVKGLFGRSYSHRPLVSP
jgi:Domain of unknown function (DUF202)